MEQPTPFIFSRFADETQHPRLNCLCPGFELKKWRFERLAAHLTDWLPDFAIRNDNLPPDLINIADYRTLIETAARRVYNTEKSERRGEIGELLLHIACRQFVGTFPTISKVFYKTATNDVVKGFDLVHTRYDAARDELELWLGEAKFYTSGAEAISDAISSISKHMQAGFMTSEKILLGGKVSSNTPGYSKLEWLFRRDTPLDEIFHRMVIPVLIAYDTKHAPSYEDDISYDTAIRAELTSFQAALSKTVPKEISFYSFYVPMDSKRKLIDAFDAKLGAYL